MMVVADTKGLVLIFKSRKELSNHIKNLGDMRDNPKQKFPAFYGVYEDSMDHRAIGRHFHPLVRKFRKSGR